MFLSMATYSIVILLTWLVRLEQLLIEYFDQGHNDVMNQI